MRYCGHFLIKVEGGAKNYKREHPLLSSWRPFTVVFVQRKVYRRQTIVNTNSWEAKHFVKNGPSIYHFRDYLLCLK